MGRGDLPDEAFGLPDRFDAVLADAATHLLVAGTVVLELVGCEILVLAVVAFHLGLRHILLVVQGQIDAFVGVVVVLGVVLLDLALEVLLGLLAADEPDGDEDVDEDDH